MSRRVVRALKKSIRHWERICTGDDTEIGSSQCALCLIFHSDFRTDGKSCCTGCPVAIRAGRTNCAGTPFIDVIRARGAVKYHMAQEKFAMNHAHWLDDYHLKLGRLLVAQRAELQSLRGLLPPEHARAS